MISFSMPVKAFNFESAREIIKSFSFHVVRRWLHQDSTNPNSAQNFDFFCEDGHAAESGTLAVRRKPSLLVTSMHDC